MASREAQPDSIIIRHLSGTKALTVDKYPLSRFKTLTFGRYSNQIVKYDREEEICVSREHARPEVEPPGS